jgi:hypothetical protein
MANDGVARFIEDQLRKIRREFYPRARWGEKRFYQDRPMLIQAITWPARWMNDRGVKALPSVYRGILSTVIETIKLHGNRAEVRRFSLYFFKSVQEHMNHHGEEYYYQAKVRPVSGILSDVTRNLGRVQSPDPTTSVLSQINQVIRSKGGRRRRDSDSQPYLLPASKSAKPRQPSEQKGHLLPPEVAHSGPRTSVCKPLADVLNSRDSA